MRDRTACRDNRQRDFKRGYGRPQAPGIIASLIVHAASHDASSRLRLAADAHHNAQKEPAVVNRQGLLGKTEFDLMARRVDDVADVQAFGGFQGKFRRDVKLLAGRMRVHVPIGNEFANDRQAHFAAGRDAIVREDRPGAQDFVGQRGSARCRPQHSRRDHAQKCAQDKRRSL